MEKKLKNNKESVQKMPKRASGSVFRLYIDLFLTFFRIGALTFGGGYAMMPMFKKELVEKHGWCSEEDLLDYYAVAQCTPGVIAVNTASFIGYRKKGVVGAIFATLGVVAPSVLIITVIAACIRQFADNVWVKHALSGIRVAVCAMVSVTVFGLLRKSVKDVLTLLLAAAAFVLTFFFGLSPVIAVVAAAAAGVISGVWKERRRVRSAAGEKQAPEGSSEHEKKEADPKK